MFVGEPSAQTLTLKKHMLSTCVFLILNVVTAQRMVALGGTLYLAIGVPNKPTLCFWSIFPL